MSKKGTLTEEARAEALGRVTPTGGLEPLREADLIIEAVFETVEVKKEVWGRVNEVAA